MQTDSEGIVAARRAATRRRDHSAKRMVGGTAEDWLSTSLEMAQNRPESVGIGRNRSDADWHACCGAAACGNVPADQRIAMAAGGYGGGVFPTSPAFVTPIRCAARRLPT